MAAQGKPDPRVELEVARCLVIEAQARVDHQRELLAQLRRDGRTTDHAERFLALLETTLRQMMRHAEILMAEVKEDDDRQR
jgi:hypothetical protein